MPSVKAQCIVCRRAALLTCVTNVAGVGPGHSALALDGYVYTFERVSGAWLVPGGSAWLQIPVRDYLAANTHRPVIVQELDVARADATAMREYIVESDLADADYGSSGVCSQQAASALSAGLDLQVNPIGLNSPYRIYRHLKHTGAVSRSYHTFPGRGAAMVGKNALLGYLYTPECTRHEAAPPILAW